MPPAIPQHLLLLLIVLCSSVLLVQSVVPEHKTFQFINQGEWSYVSDNNRVIPVPSSYPFGLYFYITGNDYNKLVLGITGGHALPGDVVVWVWSANRNDPVGQHSTLTFGSDGNLVVADSDGRIAWQTNTANKGVTGISMQPNGNLVLHDKDGRFIWQSFNYPSDGLLVGQSLMHSRCKKLVSRISETDSRDGPYSLVIGKNGFIMYQNKSGTLVRYAGWEANGLHNVKYDSVQQDEPTTATYFLTLGFANKKQAENTSSTPSQPPFIDMTNRDGLHPPSPESEAPSPAPVKMALPHLRPLQRRVILAKVYFGDLMDTHWKIRANISYSFLRLEPDGNLKVHNFYTWSNFSSYWYDSYAFFGNTVGECALGSKCGASGSCNMETCSACPPNGAVGCMINT
ncbi:hypothetical protein C5167_011943 [Papaver somniferum]|uniref:Bulb-type lectin domain-containing protein n=1 Tax=Papaver somniferum TaxID=3469 RepID=A0A4Y7IWQ2_PAPSO|nr:EP1-like glycoprotein 2 [Papaver somniferum]RZC53077.1 hypothetical protein C5167_011943 [Papaver somniferum]